MYFWFYSSPVLFSYGSFLVYLLFIYLLIIVKAPGFLTGILPSLVNYGVFYSEKLSLKFLADLLMS